VPACGVARAWAVGVARALSSLRALAGLS